MQIAAENRIDITTQNPLVATPCGFESHHRHQLVASAISLATSFFISLQSLSYAHSAAPRFQIEPAALGFDLVLGTNLQTVASILLRYSKNPERDRVRDFYLFKGSLFVHHGEVSNRLTHCVPPVAQLPGERFFMASEVFLLRSFPRKAVESFMKPFRNKISPLEANDYRLPFSALLTEIRLFREMKAPGIVSRAGDLIPAIRTKFCH